MSGVSVVGRNDGRTDGRMDGTGNRRIASPSALSFPLSVQRSDSEDEQQYLQIQVYSA